MQTKIEQDDIVIELKLPVPVKELAAITDALCKIHGKNSLFMRQTGTMLQLYKPRATNPPNDQELSHAAGDSRKPESRSANRPA